MIHGSCSDYRAAAAIDLDHDAADLDRKVAAPLLAFYGANGLMAKLFDVPAEWRKRAENMRAGLLAQRAFLSGSPAAGDGRHADLISARDGLSGGVRERPRGPLPCSGAFRVIATRPQRTGYSAAW